MTSTPEACVGVSGPLLMVGTAPCCEAVFPVAVAQSGNSEIRASKPRWARVWGLRN